MPVKIGYACSSILLLLPKQQLIPKLPPIILSFQLLLQAFVELAEALGVVGDGFEIAARAVVEEVLEVFGGYIFEGLEEIELVVIISLPGLIVEEGRHVVQVRPPERI